MLTSSLIFLGCTLFCTPVTVNAQVALWKAPAFVDTIRNPVSPIGPLVEEAKKIYNNTCWPCHGLDGKGSGPAAQQLNPKPADHTSVAVQKESDGALFWKISTGKGTMQPYAKVLTVKQRWALVQYIRSLGGNGKSKLSQNGN